VALTAEQRSRHAAEVRLSSLTVLRGLLPAAKIDALAAAFAPLLQRAVRRDGAEGNRGPHRHYVTLPFEPPWADPEIIDHDDVLGVVSDLLGEDGALTEFAADTPLAGSQHQAVHRDAGALFPEGYPATPAYLLAVNIPLADVTAQNGPVEVALGTHDLSDAEALRRLESGEAALTPVLLARGDVLIRDVRHLHRGTPNQSGAPRPMVVLGFHRRWFYRHDIDIAVPARVLADLPDRARRWLRFNPVVEGAVEERAERSVLPAGVRA
jgi:ectoine hydroxylase-related dioxygenase (phytanoyl-CoA dioxygenase family)